MRRISTVISSVFSALPSSLNNHESRSKSRDTPSLSQRVTKFLNDGELVVTNLPVREVEHAPGKAVDGLGFRVASRTPLLVHVFLLVADKQMRVCLLEGA